jgi:hypothetical protein
VPWRSSSGLFGLGDAEHLGELVAVVGAPFGEAAVVGGHVDADAVAAEGFGDHRCGSGAAEGVEDDGGGGVGGGFGAGAGVAGDGLLVGTGCALHLAVKPRRARSTTPRAIASTSPRGRPPLLGLARDRPPTFPALDAHPGRRPALDDPLRPLGRERGEVVDAEVVGDAEGFGGDGPDGAGELAERGFVVKFG